MRTPVVLNRDDTKNQLEKEKKIKMNTFLRKKIIVFY